MGVVAIMGRPNVGKSTLFNRLMRARSALVDPTAGLTRDLRQHDCQIGGETVSLIDTAGLVKEKEKATTLTAQMTKQALKAIEAADLVLFVIDGRSDLLPADEMWAQFLRKTAKKVLLIANKCEGTKQANNGKLEASRLGFGEALAISAEHNIGMATLEYEILSQLETAPEVEVEVEVKIETESESEAKPDRPLKLAIIGRPNAGKSSLVNLLLGEERQLTGAQAGITRDSIGIHWEWEGQKITLYDTAGLRRPSRVVERTEKLSVSSALQAIRFSDIVVLLLDVEKPFESQDLRLAELVIREGRGLVLAVNKIDLMPQVAEADIQKAAANYLPQVKGLPVLCLSAKTGEGLERVMPRVMAAKKAWSTEINTSSLNKWLQTCIARNPPPAAGGRPMRVKYITQKSTCPPDFIIFTSRTKKLTDDYMRYLMNDMKKNFKFEGTPLRLDVRATANPYV